MPNIVEYSPEFSLSQEFLEKVREFKKDMHDFYARIGEEQTPPFDAQGRKIIDKRPDGKDYIIEGYMRKKLDQYFPGWTLEMAAPLNFLGVYWVVAQVHLCIIDERLIPFGVMPPIRKFYGVDSVRLQYGKGSDRTPENIVDVGDNCKQAVSAAFKYAINRLTNIGDDIYGKRMDLEGAGTIDEIMSKSESSSPVIVAMFNKYIKDKNLRPSQVFSILGITNMSEISDYKVAYQKIKEHIEGGANA